MADPKAHINIGFTLLFTALSQSPALLETIINSLIRCGIIAVPLSVAILLTVALMVVFPRTGGGQIHKSGQMVKPFYFGMFAQLDLDSQVD
jgi:hypothetical protein